LTFYAIEKARATRRCGLGIRTASAANNQERLD
jgi:hypothetical protein